MDEKLKHALVQLKQLVDEIETRLAWESEPERGWWYFRYYGNGGRTTMVSVTFGTRPGERWKRFYPHESAEEHHVASFYDRVGGNE